MIYLDFDFQRGANGIYRLRAEGNPWSYVARFSIRNDPTSLREFFGTDSESELPASVIGKLNNHLR